MIPESRFNRFKRLTLVSIVFWGILNLMACQEHQSNVKTFSQIGECVFDVGFPSRSKTCSVGGEDYICHYDFMTHKKIVVNQLGGDDSLVIPLNEVLKVVDKVVAFEILNWDSIYVLADHVSELFIIDSLGRVKDRIDLKPYFDQEGKYELHARSNQFILNDTSMIFALGFLQENILDTFENDVERLQAYDRQLYRAPRLFKIDHFLADTFSVHFGTRQLYSRFSAENVLTYDRLNFKILQGEIVFTSAYTDSIYFIDPMTLKVKKSIEIKSNYTELVLDHITRAEDRKNRDRFMYNYSSNGYVNDVMFDPVSGYYFVSIVHKPKAVSGQKMPPIKTWSFVVLNQQFKQVKELFMDFDEYGFTSLPSAKGIYLFTRKLKPEDPAFLRTKYYSIFNYE